MSKYDVNTWDRLERRRDSLPEFPPNVEKVNRLGQTVYWETEFCRIDGKPGDDAYDKLEHAIDFFDRQIARARSAKANLRMGKHPAQLLVFASPRVSERVVELFGVVIPLLIQQRALLTSLVFASLEPEKIGKAYFIDGETDESVDEKIRAATARVEAAVAVIKEYDGLITAYENADSKWYHFLDVFRDSLLPPEVQRRIIGRFEFASSILLKHSSTV